MLPTPHLSCTNVLFQCHTASQIWELISRLLVPPLALFIFLGSWVSYSCGDEQLGTGWASTAQKCFVLSNRVAQGSVCRGQVEPLWPAQWRLLRTTSTFHQSPTHPTCCASAHLSGFRSSCFLTPLTSWAVLGSLWLQRKFSTDPSRKFSFILPVKTVSIEHFRSPFCRLLFCKGIML